MRNFAHKCRFWLLSEGRHFFSTRSPFGTVPEEPNFCVRVDLETQISHNISVYGYLLALTFGSEQN